jgi:uncharacterized protein (DUF342 family)
MATNKTAETILYKNLAKVNAPVPVDEILVAMEEYANQQTSTLQKEIDQLKAKLQEAEKLVGDLKWKLVDNKTYELANDAKNIQELLLTKS